MEYLIAPMDVNEFYEQYFEAKPFMIKRNCKSYYEKWFNLKEMERIIKNHSLTFGEEIDVTKYVNGCRKTLNPKGFAEEKQVWKMYQSGCSLRLLCPQMYSDGLWKLLANLETEWQCNAGSNVYLTPKGTQGFAPHYDDIEAFLLQVEGRKYWKLYEPMSEDTKLPMTSSENFKPEQLGEPIFEGWLNAGDVLYFPRGYIHQGKAAVDEHSLHVTVSTGQQNSWGNFLQTLLPGAISAAMENNVALRSALPRNYFEYMGAIHSDHDDNAERKVFQDTVKNKLKKVLSTAIQMLDSASDQMACNFLVERLPPVLLQHEEDHSHENSPAPKLTVNSCVRLIRQDVLRMAIEGGKAIVYHAMDNGRKRYQNEFQPLEFELDDAPSIEMIINAYPDYVRVGNLPHEDCDDQVDLVKSLYNEGVIMFQTAE